MNSRTQRAIFAGAAILFLTALLNSYLNPSMEPRAPKISVVPLSYDFGVIPQKMVEHGFQVKNEGNKTLEILQVTTSCGCTTAEIDSKSIQPGQTARLLVRFDPNAMKEAVQGKAERVVYIKSNDPAQPEVEIEITAFVKADLLGE